MKKIALTAMLMAAATCLAAQPDFNGVWKVTEYHTRLVTVDGAEPPLLPAATSLYKGRLIAFGKGDTSFDLTARQCASPGTPRALFLPYPFEIIQTTQQITFLFEWNHLFRMAPVGSAREYGYTTAMGASKAMLEGETLVVHTDNLAENTFLDASGLPHSENLQVTERYQLTDDGKSMTLRIRFEDPDTFMAPWESVAKFKRLPGYKLKEDVCLDRQARGEPAIRR